MIHFLPFCFFLLISVSGFSQEICNNGVDDDGNGLIDLQESSCTCSMAYTPTSLIPNPSFEDSLCCPNNNSQLYCANHWFQASDATSDYFNCGYSFIQGLFSTPLGVYPDGSGIAGFIYASQYKEYIGACLTQPMQAGTSYTLNFTAGGLGISPINYTCDFLITIDTLTLSVFGTSFCSNMPFAGSDCPPANFQELGTVKLSIDEQYYTLSLTFTPTSNYSGIMIGPSCVFDPAIPNQNAMCFPYVLVDNFIINESSSFSPVQIDYTGSLCDGDLVLSASVDTLGGIFQWYQDSIALVGQTYSTLAVSSLGLGSGSYQAVYTLPGGCLAGTVSFTNDIPVVQVTDQFICAGDSAVIVVQGADTYLWNPPPSSSNDSESTVVVHPSVTTVYTLTGITPGCSTDTTITVTVGNINVSVNNVSACVGDSVTLSASGANTYSWSPSSGLSATTGAVVTLQATSDISYTVIGTSALGCTDTVAAQVSVLQIPQAVIQTNVTNGIPGQEIDFNNNSTNASSYYWDFGNGQTANTTNLSDIYAIQYENPGTYTVTLTATNAGCSDDDSLNLIISIPKVEVLEIPNIITPNNDGVNDLFTITAFYAASIEITILDRWGNTIIVFDAMNTSWNGKTSFGKAVNDGVYFVLYRIEELDGSWFEGQGFLQVIQ